MKYIEIHYIKIIKMGTENGKCLPLRKFYVIGMAKMIVEEKENSSSPWFKLAFILYRKSEYDK